MEIETLTGIRLLLDFGLVVLIWLVQLVIYPGFLYLQEKSLSAWHSRYTVRVSYVVVPLMAGQLILSGYALLEDLTVMRMMVFALVMGTWISTFFQAVPLHNQISGGGGTLTARIKLVRINGIRTSIWTGVFILDLLDVLL